MCDFQSEYTCDQIDVGGYIEVRFVLDRGLEAEFKVSTCCSKGKSHLNKGANYQKESRDIERCRKCTLDAS